MSVSIAPHLSTEGVLCVGSRFFGSSSDPSQLTSEKWRTWMAATHLLLSPKVSLTET